jgi:peroxiredoxin
MDVAADRLRGGVGGIMPRIELKAPAPDFSLADFSGKPVRLSDFRGKSNVLLVFNRGFF